MRTQVRGRSISDFPYTPLAAALAMALAPQAVSAANIVVNDSSDSGAFNSSTLTGTLRGAIDYVNELCTGSDQITFSGGPFTINVSTDLPTITCQGLTINGGGTKTAAVISLYNYGGNLNPALQANVTSGANVKIKGLKISGWSYGSNTTALYGTIDADNNILTQNGTGVYLPYGGSVTNNTITSGYTGIDAEYGDVTITGNTISGMTWDGIDFYTTGTISNNTVTDCAYGGIYTEEATVTIQSNTVSGNGTGIELDDDYGSTVSGNKIGTNAAGTSAMGNSYTGLYLWWADSTTVSNNVISANYGGGIYVEYGGGLTISGNKVGTDATGAVSLANDLGISLNYSGYITVSGNTIVASGDSIDVYDGYWYGGSVTLSGNKIGTNSAGTADLAHNTEGYGIYAGCSEVAAQSNVIVSGYYGIFLEAVTGGGSNDISGNKINVAGDGVTPLGGLSYGILLQDASCESEGLLAAKKSSATGSGVLRQPPGPARGAVMSRAKALSTGSHHARTHRKSAHAQPVHRKDTADSGSTTNLMISGNTVTNLRRSGVFVNGGFDSTITGNTIVNNQYWGVDIEYGAGIEISDNVIYGNGTSSDITFTKNVNLGFPNDIYTNDTGTAVTTRPNDGATPPLINQALPDYIGGTTTVYFQLAAPPGSYKVQVCQNAQAVPGCKSVAGTVSSFAVSSLPTYGSVTFPGITGNNFSASATNLSSGDSSEFSATVALTPTPAATYTPASVDFGNVASGTDSAPRTITIKSLGGLPYRISTLGSPVCDGGPICGDGGFTCTTNCLPGTDYTTNQSCSITATFTPSTTGEFSESIGICDNAYGGTITLTGVGVTPPPVSVSPASWDFGSQPVRTVGPTKLFRVVNTTPLDTAIGAPTTSSNDFVVVDTDCTSTLASAATCSVDVAFDPQSTGAINGNLFIPVASGPAPKVEAVGTKAADVTGPLPGSASLTGVGVIQAILALPSAVDLGTYTQGDPANTTTLTLKNNGNGPLTFSGITVTGPFDMDNGCTTDVQPGGTCTITLSYSDHDLGAHTGTLAVVSNAVGGSRSIALTATTVALPTPIVTVNPTQIGFGSRMLGTLSAPQRITISNSGNAPASISTSISSTDFLVTNTCGATLAAGSSCYADVVLRPVGFGPRRGVFEIDANAAGSPFTVTLSGTGCRPFFAGSTRLGSSISCSP